MHDLLEIVVFNSLYRSSLSSNIELRTIYKDKEAPSLSSARNEVAACISHEYFTILWMSVVLQEMAVVVEV